MPIKLLQKAVEILKADLAKGYDHIVMARCKNKARANEVYKIYQQYQDYDPVIVYSGMPNAIGTLKAIKEKKHRIIVCVNMLGKVMTCLNLK